MAPRSDRDVIRAARVVTPDGVIGPAAITLEDGLVTGVRTLPAGSPVPDRTIVPGFVDLQVNGIDDIDVATAQGADWDRLDRRLLAQGVTTWYPTIISAPLDTYAEALGRIDAAAHRPPGARPAIAGVHLEGPFLGTAVGVHSAAVVVPIDGAWLARLPPLVRLVTLAPEADGAPDAIRHLTANGVVVALGHSTASYEQAAAAVDAGARLVTHLFNAMGPLHHRRPGLVGAALADDRLAVSLIADAIHVHPALLATVFRAKGAGRVVLVTDAVAWRAPSMAGLGVSVVDGAPRTPDGTLAGSVLTMDQALRTVVGAGVALVDAVTAASTTPATVLGLADRGRIAAGLRADLVALSPALAVEAVWVTGEPAAATVFRAPGPTGAAERAQSCRWRTEGQD